MSKSVKESTVEILALYSLGVPLAVICTEYEIRPDTLRSLASYHKVRRPDDSDAVFFHRIARCERISRHVKEYPGTSLFSTLEAAA